MSRYLDRWCVAEIGTTFFQWLSRRRVFGFGLFTSVLCMHATSGLAQPAIFSLDAPPGFNIESLPTLDSNPRYIRPSPNSQFVIDTESITLTFSTRYGDYPLTYISIWDNGEIEARQIRCFQQRQSEQRLLGSFNENSTDEFYRGWDFTVDDWHPVPANSPAEEAADFVCSQHPFPEDLKE